MVLTTLTWDKVIIKYKKQKTTDIYHQAMVSFDSKDKGLRIVENGALTKEKFLLLARAELISATPWEMKWKAYWWSARAGGKKYTKLIEAEVVCTF